MYKEDALKLAIEIAKARSGSASPGVGSAVIEDAYDKIVEIASAGNFLEDNP